MKLAVISFTSQGGKLNERLVKRLNQLSYECAGYVKMRYRQDLYPSGLLNVEESLYDWTKMAFSLYDGIIFISAAGIAVRAIAPFIKDKTTDPAVLVIDDNAKHVISLLSGHIGGANELALLTADITGAEPVITTSTDVNEVFAVDVFARQEGLEISDIKLVKSISADLLEGIPVGFFSDFPLEGTIPEGFTQKEKCLDNVWITCKRRPEVDDLCYMFLEDGSEVLKLIPQVVILGIGCKKGIERDQILAALELTLDDLNIMTESVCGIVSIDRKSDEKGLIKTADLLDVPFITYTADELNAVEGDFEESEFVKEITGTSNVCQRAAKKAVEDKGGFLTGRKYKYDGVTVAVGMLPWKGMIQA